MTTYVREDGLRCLELPLFADAQSVRSTLNELMTAQLGWFWESARRDGSLNRSLTRLSPLNAEVLVADSSDRDDDGFGREIVIYGIETDAILRQDEVKDSVARFLQGSQSPIQLVIVQAGDDPDARIFVRIGSAPVVEALLGSLGITGYTKGDEKPYKQLRSARLEVLFRMAPQGQMTIWPLLATCVVWCAITGASAYSYVVSRITSPDAAPGYETEWGFQLLMFAIFRLPLFLGGLGLVWWFGRSLNPR